MSTKLKHPLMLLILCMAFSNCKKEKREASQEVDASINENITKIASSRAKFNEWVDTVQKNKFGTIYPFSIEKVSLTQQLNEFKMAEVWVKANGNTFNFFVGGVLEFIQQPESQKYVLKPHVDMPTPVRNLIFSSGNSDGNLRMTFSQDTTYTITTNERSLFLLGAFADNLKLVEDASLVTGTK